MPSLKSTANGGEGRRDHSPPANGAEMSSESPNAALWDVQSTMNSVQSAAMESIAIALPRWELAPGPRYRWWTVSASREHVKLGPMTMVLLRDRFRSGSPLFFEVSVLGRYLVLSTLRSRWFRFRF